MKSRGFAIPYKSQKKGVTLVELLLALALGALILSSLATVFNIGWRSWKENNEKSELIQHARVAMWRITNELKYAESLDLMPVSGSSGSLEFTTRNLSAGSGVVRYQVEDSVLERTFEGVSSEIAGSPAEGIYVTSLDVTPKKLYWEDLATGDSLSLAIAVDVSLTLEDADENDFTISSAAKFRNIE